MVPDTSVRFFTAVQEKWGLFVYSMLCRLFSNIRQLNGWPPYASPTGDSAVASR
jgi:hypothetical protein